MVAKFKKSRWFHYLLGTVLVAALAAFGLTKAQMAEENKPEDKNVAQKQAEAKAENEPYRVRGKVVDPDGKPVEGALLLWTTEPNDYWENRISAVKTDKEGNYLSPTLKKMKGAVTVIAGGFAPDMKEVEFQEETQIADFRLQKGKTLEVRFVDEQGEPVPGVKLKMGGNPDSWWRKKSNIWTGENQRFHSTKIPYVADENGVYRWTWAPEDRVLFNYQKEGYLYIFNEPHHSPDVWLTPEKGPYTIVMHKRTQVFGTVVEEETGKPINDYHVFVGNIRKNYSPGDIGWQSESTEMNKPTENSFEETTMFFNADGYRIRIDADGYESYVSRDIKPGEESITIEAKLKKSVGLTGTVLLPDGSPAAGTKIYLAGDGTYIQVSGPPNSDLLRWRTVAATADAQGKFTIYPKPGESFALYLEHPQGLLWVNRDIFLKDSNITLRGYANMTLHVPPVQAQELEERLWLNSMDLGRDGFGSIDYQAELRTKTKDGKIAFENIVAGKYELQISSKSPDHTWVRGSTAWHTLEMPFEISAGENKTLDINAALKGPKVVGKLRLPEEYTETFQARDWSYNRVELGTIEINDKITKLAVWLKIDPENPRRGIFEFNSVPPGKYVFLTRLAKAPADTSVSSNGFTPVFGGANQTIEITDTEGVTDLGVILLKTMGVVQ